MVKIVIVFLLVMLGLALIGGPGFRRAMCKLLGISRRDL